MGMHEFEYVVEGSIKCLNKSKRDDLDYRSIFYTLYDFQKWWDTGSTEFRCIDILEKHGYVYIFDIEEYPEYNKYKDYFDSIEEEIITGIREVPTKDWDPETNPLLGAFFLKKNSEKLIYVFVNQLLWTRFVELGKLKGNDTKAAIKLDLKEVVLEILIEAEKQADIELISWWYPIFPMIFAGIENNDEILIDKCLKEIRDIIIRTRAYEIDNDYGCARLPDEDQLRIISGESEFNDWWFEPLKKQYAIDDSGDGFSVDNCTDQIPLPPPPPPKEDAFQTASEINEISRGLSIEENATLFVSEGITHALMNKYEEAVQSFDEAVNLDPNNDQIYAYTGYAYHQLGNMNFARSNFCEALEINDKNAFAYYYLKKNNSLGKDQKAEVYLEYLFNNMNGDEYLDSFFYNMTTKKKSINDENWATIFLRIGISKDSCNIVLQCEELFIKYYDELFIYSNYDMLCCFNSYLLALWELGEYKKGSLFSDALSDEGRKGNPYICHNAACLYVAVDELEKAMKEVNIACENNYDLIERLLTDEDLKPLFEKDDFKKQKERFMVE